MGKAKKCSSLEEVRNQIDLIDKQIVELIAIRGEYVQQAAKYKKTTDDVKAPQRVEQIINKVKSIAQETGANEIVTENVYRSMISSFINAEIDEFGKINNKMS